MPKRSTVLMFYDRVHRASVTTMIVFSLSIAAVGFIKVCDIFFNPKPLVIPGPEDHEDYKKMLEYRRQQEGKEQLST